MTETWYLFCTGFRFLLLSVVDVEPGHTPLLHANADTAVINSEVHEYVACTFILTLPMRMEAVCTYEIPATLPMFTGHTVA